MIGINESFGILMAGGESGSPPVGGVTLTSAWAYRPPQGWVNLSRDDVDIFGVAAAYDAKSHRVIVVGEDTTWSYDPSNNTWESHQGGGQPTNTLGALAAYDVGSDRVILLDLDAATWAYDFDNMSWTDMQPELNPTGQGRDFYMMAYDEDSDRIILFGGWRNRSDTWAYDYDTNTWTEMTPDINPPGRQYGTMVYDPGTDRMILYGGVTDPGNSALGDTWAYDYDGNTWTELSPTLSPQPRGRHGMAYDPIDGTIVLFGGGSGPAWEERPTSTWIFNPSFNTWTEDG
jgi:hypothetical protein